MYSEKILKKAEEISDILISIRRDLHAYPEIGLEEIRTSKIVADYLSDLGLEVQKNVGKTGVVGLLRGKNPGKTVMLRADMDCLKMDENCNLQYKSKNPGLMHACGHDIHTTWLLGAAMILASMKDKINGNIKFVFQPAEEVSGGAKMMIEDNVLENPHVDAAFGAHVWPYIEEGTVAIKEGSFMAASDNFKLSIFGKGGHGGHPQRCIDPISSACEIYMALQTIISRRVNPLEPAVITVGKFHAGTAHNVIPSQVEMEGTIRTLTNETRQSIYDMMLNIFKGVTIANGSSFDFKYIPYHPPVINDSNLTEIVLSAAKKIVGEDKAKRAERETMVGEDFSYYQQNVPGAFFWFGSYNEEIGAVNPLHSEKFFVNEDIIHTGAAVLAQCAVEYLSNATSG